MKLFYCSYSKNANGEVAFLTFMSASKHVLFVLGVNLTARNAGEGGGSDLVSQATPFAVSCGLVAIHVPRYINLVSPSLARRQANAVEFATKVCFSTARLMSCTKGKLCNVHVAPLATCSVYRYTYVDRS